ncbi:MAG: type II secretion system F family protein [Kiritimatiellia bacterium]
MDEKQKRTTVHVKGAGEIRKKDLIPFTRQMSGMLNAGMSVLAALSALEEQCSNPNFKIVLIQLRERIEGGAPFSDGLADFPQLFDEMYVNMVAAGERSGQFAPVLRRLADILHSSARLVRKVKSALTYPVVILSMALLIAAGLITFILPVFVGMFSDFGAELPGPTQALLSVSDFIRGYWYIVIGAAIVGGFAFKKWVASDKGMYAFAKFRLRMPIFGELNLKVGIGRFCRLFAQMLTSGVPILESMEIVSRSLGNKVLEASIQSAKFEVEQGNTLMYRMIAAGEKSGRIDEMLSNIADTYDEEVESSLSTLTSLMEPLLMMFLGVVIGGIVVAMFLPIFKMGSVVG